MNEKNSSVSSGEYRWLLTVSFKMLMKNVNECFQGVLGQHTLLCKQYECLRILCAKIKELIDTKRSLDNMELLNVVGERNVVANITSPDGNYVINDISNTTILENACIEAAFSLSALP